MSTDKNISLPVVIELVMIVIGFLLLLIVTLLASHRGFNNVAGRGTYARLWVYNLESKGCMWLIN